MVLFIGIAVTAVMLGVAGVLGMLYLLSIGVLLLIADVLYLAICRPAGTSRAAEPFDGLRSAPNSPHARYTP